ncbi:MAG: EAL domain-containing protein [Rhodospirillales bacterium]|nr:EAL domain-containing protein [Rhodospirillales bacterium]
MSALRSRLFSKRPGGRSGVLIGQKARRLILFLAAAVLLAVVPTALALAVTYGAAVEHARVRLGDVAARTAERVRNVLWSAEGILSSVDYAAREEGCGGDLVSTFAAAAATYDWVRGISFISARGRLVCTSYGAFDPPVPVRNRQLTLLGEEGSAVRFTAPMNADLMPGSSILAVHDLTRGRYRGARVVVAIAPTELLASADAAVLGAAGRIEVLMGGSELAGAGPGEKGSPKEWLSASRDVGLFAARVEVAAGRDWALAGWRRTAVPIASIGGLAAVVFVIGAVRLASRRASMRDDLRDALENGELAVHYQPVIDLQNDRCVGAEALIRWTRSSGAMISPDVFIHLAEDTGDIVPMTRWLMDRVGEEIGERLRKDDSLHIAINLAPIHFSDARVSAAADARAVAAKAGFPLGRMQFEITERALVDEERCKTVIAALHEQGNEVAIDDFGTGYSSLSYVGNFPVNALKIDKAFVKTIGSDAVSAGLADIIVEMARTLRLKVIAEGIETEAQAKHLRARGVDFAQGWLYAKPLPADDFLAFMDRYNARGATSPRP